MVPNCSLDRHCGRLDHLATSTIPRKVARSLAGLAMLLTSRQLLQAKAIDIENDLRGTLRNFGLKVGIVGTAKFEARVRELIAEEADLAAIAEPLLIARRVLREQLGVLHRRLLAIVREDEVCRRLMTV